VGAGSTVPGAFAHHGRVIVVAGEALIDLIVHPDGRLAAVPGGGPFNTARTIGRLGGRVGFLGRISSDRFGISLRRGLEADGVDLGATVTCDEPTTLAVAELDRRGAAEYRFYLAGTSAPGLVLDDVLAGLRSRPDALHIGTLGLVAEPIGSALAVGLDRLEPSTVVMVDPNCRPRVIADRAAYLRRLAEVLARADIVKVSADDLAFMSPGSDPATAARALLDVAPGVVLLTDGARTVRVFAHRYALDVPVPAADVVDTVGSGDAFGGAFLAWLMGSGGGRQGLAEAEVVREAVARAIEVARLTCLRPGADPPRRDEVSWPAA
jgi:fructokinase